MKLVLSAILKALRGADPKAPDQPESQHFHRKLKCYSLARAQTFFGLAQAIR